MISRGRRMAIVSVAESLRRYAMKLCSVPAAGLSTDSGSACSLASRTCIRQSALVFPAAQVPNRTKTGIHFKVSGKDKRLVVRCAGRQAKRRGSNIHFAIANHDVAVAAKAFYTFVFVNVIVVSVKEVTVANHKVEHRIRVAIRIGWVATEDIENGATIVTTRRN